MAPSRLAAAFTLLAIFGGTVQARRDAPQSQTPPAAKPPDQLDRIKAALKRPNTIILTDNQVRFYVEIRERFPSVEEMFRGVDLLHGPRAGGPAMTHAEYLSMVTPRDTIATSGGIKPTEALQFAITNWLGQMLVRKALEEINNAKSEAEVEAIRERITRELAALTAGRGGGL
jgi:hypothetical protein